jgi:hypothetical protein
LVSSIIVPFFISNEIYMPLVKVTHRGQRSDKN